MAARKKCPNLIIIPPDFHLYVENSKALISLLKSYSDHVVQYSIDEAWADFTGYEMLYGDPVEFAWKLKDQIREELGFTVNIGVSSNRLWPKWPGISKTGFGTYPVPGGNWKKNVAAPVERLFLVGKAAADRLHSLGIYTMRRSGPFGCGRSEGPYEKAWRGYLELCMGTWRKRTHWKQRKAIRPTETA